MAPVVSSHVDLHGPTARFGDLLPLVVGGEVLDRSGDLGKGCVRRVSKRLALSGAVDETAAALNELAGFNDPATWPRSPVNQAQASSLARIRAWHAESPAKCMNEEVSLCEMLKTTGGYLATVGELATFRDGVVSLPDDQGSATQLRHLLEGEALDAILDPEGKMLLSEAELGGVLQDTELPGKYFDPVLQHNESVYGDFYLTFLSQA